MPKTLDEQTLEVCRNYEPEFILALELYYTNFGTPMSVTFNEAAHKAGANPAFLVNYMTYRKEHRLGAPSEAEEAEEYLGNLQRLKKDLSLS